MSFVWISKRSGQQVKGGGCIGCIPIPFGCVSLFVLAAGVGAWLLA